MSSRDLSDQDKLRVLLPHWLEHNESHAEEFGRWAELLRESGEPEVSVLLAKAMKGLQDADQAFAEALELLGGSLADTGTHHHHHDD